MQRGKRTRHSDDTGGLAAKPVRSQTSERDAGLPREPQFALAPPALGTDEEARHRPDNCLDGLQTRVVVQEHTGLPRLRYGVPERYRLCHFRHAEPERLAGRGLGHPPPPPDLPLARVHDAAFGQERHYPRGPDLGGLLDHEVHPSALGYGLVERDHEVVTDGRRQLLSYDCLSPTAQLGGEKPPRAVYDLDSVSCPATEDLENVISLVWRQLQRFVGPQCEVEEDSGYGRARNEAPYLKTPRRRSKKEPPPPL